MMLYEGVGVDDPSVIDTQAVVRKRVAAQQEPAGTHRKGSAQQSWPGGIKHQGEYQGYRLSHVLLALSTGLSSSDLSQ